MSQFGRTFQHLMDYTVRGFVKKNLQIYEEMEDGHIKAQVNGKIDAWMGGPICHTTKVPIYSKFWSNYGNYN